jgi:hypothetical protein
MNIFILYISHFSISFFLFRICGTPNEQVWPEVVEFPDWRSTFPKWKPQPLAKLCPNLSEEGVDLLQVVILLLFLLLLLLLFCVTV